MLPTGEASWLVCDIAFELIPFAPSPPVGATLEFVASVDCDVSVFRSSSAAPHAVKKTAEETTRRALAEIMMYP